MAEEQVSMEPYLRVLGTQLNQCIGKKVALVGTITGGPDAPNIVTLKANDVILNVKLPDRILLPPLLSLLSAASLKISKLIRLFFSRICSDGNQH